VNRFDEVCNVWSRAPVLVFRSRGERKGADVGGDRACVL
jgi:hypothetical protein